MELKLTITTKNSFPKGGILIRSTTPDDWLHEIQTMGLSLDAVKVFPVPGRNANEVFGCLVVLIQNKTKITDCGKNNFCQLIGNKLFIPENTEITPQLTKEEWQNLFSEYYHFMHPEIGLTELKDEISWIDLITIPVTRNAEILEPSKTIHIPGFISSFRYEIDTEQILEEIDNPFSEEGTSEEMPFELEKIMNGNQQEMDKFLAFFDKNPEAALKMAIPLDTLGTARGGNDGQFSFSGSNSSSTSFRGGGNVTNRSVESGGGLAVFKVVFVLFILISVRACNFTNINLGSDSALALFVIVFVIGLIIAFALSSSSSSESYSSPSYSSSSSGAGSSRSGGSFLVDSERFAGLQNRYEKLAENFIEKKEYSRAAHIYLKLLKNHQKAADVLEKGEMYGEAAAIHLKFLHNKHKAAECYEKGHIYKQAIELYTELNQHEKVGDLYTVLKNRTDADKHYTIVIDNYKANSQYVKASLILKDKMDNREEAQNLLLTGWKNQKDALNCLNNYFANIQSTEKLSTAITSIYENEVSSDNSELFLQAIKHEFKKHQSMEEITRNIAYEIVSEKIAKRPDIASELLFFNQMNKSLLKDVMKYKLKAKR
ncbi:hypothetical protein [Flavobacterium ajazii]|uniref:hypothetical protein n=1 Tax=Flavobacterium ajazii TaxID=2692318 RepID=UPI0013CFE55F|nr:hypothetical protein [Flavobacterium ajazii]